MIGTDSWRFVKGLRLNGPMALCQPKPLSPAQARFTINCLTINLVLCVLVQKIGIPFGGESQLQLPFLLHFGTIFLLISKRIVVFHPGRFCLFLLMAFVGTLVHTYWQAALFSMPSFFLFVVLYSTYIFIIPISSDEYFALMKRFSFLGVIATLFVFIDWITQIVGLGMIDLDKIIPQSFIMGVFIYIQPLQWGHSFLRPNGIFFLEPSFSSQFIAMALVIELCFFHRIYYILILSFGLMANFGGTGLLLFALAAPFMLFHLRPILLVVLIVSAPVSLLVADQIGLLATIERRSQTFDAHGSSANQRFIIPLETALDAWAGPTREALFGIGAGNMKRGINIVWPAMLKTMREYGLVCMILWFALTTHAMFMSGAPFIIAFIAFVQYHLLNAAAVLPIVTIYCYFLTGGYYIKDRKLNKDIFYPEHFDIQNLHLATKLPIQDKNVVETTDTHKTPHISVHWRVSGQVSRA